VGLVKYWKLQGNAYFAAAAENNLKLGEFSIALNKSWVPLQF